MTYREIVEKLHEENPKYHTYVFDNYRTNAFFKEKGMCMINCIDKTLGVEDIDFNDFSPMPKDSCEIELITAKLPDDYNDFVVDGKVDEKLTIINL